MRILFAVGTAWLAATLALPGLALAEPQHKAEAIHGGLAYKIDTELAEAASQGFGGAVIIEERGEILLKAGYGLANREKGVAFTAETPAQIGSITKLFTAAAVLQLADAGKLSLNDSVKLYLPGSAEPAASSTISQLLTHTAGLTSDCGQDFEVTSLNDLEKRCMALPRKGPVGQYSYSNMGFSILAAVVEKVSGQPWDAYLAEHILRPMGMTATGFTFPATDTHGFAIGYLNDKPQPLISTTLATMHGDDRNLRGNGGIQAPAADMERFYRALSGHSSGLGPTAHEMTIPRVPSEGAAWQAYGPAVRVDVNDAPYRIGHGGSDGTFLSYFGWYPQQDIFIYIVGNNGETQVRPVIAKVMGELEAYAGVKPKPAPESAAKR